jgi:hypothetical protein
MLVGYAFLCLIPALSFPQKREAILAADVGTRLRGYDTIQLVWVALMLVQFGLVTFPLNGGLPQDFLPTAEMHAAGDALLARIEAEPGEVWLLMHPSYAVRVGKRPYAHLQSLWHARQRGAAPLPPDLVALIEQQQFAQIISDESDYFETEPAFVALLLTHYEAAEILPLEQSPQTLSGPVIRPLAVYVPRR